MSKVLSNTTQALQSGKKSIETISDNIANANALGAHRIDAVTTTTAYSGGDSLGIRTTTLRANDPFLQQSVRQNTTTASKADIINKYSQEIQIAISQPNQKNNSALVIATNALITAATGDAKDNPQLMKQNFVAKANDFTQVYNSVIEKVNSLEQQASKDLENYITELNSKLNSLSKINKSSSTTTTNTRLMDERDRVINNIAEILPIKVQELNNGQVCLRGPQGISLVDSTSYAEFSYADSKLTIVYVDQRGKKSAALEIPIEQCKDGTISGLIELQENILPKTKEQVTSSYKATINEVNRICNNSSTYPPSTKLQGQTSIRLSDEFKASGKFNLAFTDKDGNPLTGTTGRVRDVTVNLENLGSNSSGNVNTRDLIKELNELLRAPSSPRSILGEIRDNNNNPIANNYLLNDIQLVPKSELRDGKLTVGLFVDGNNYFGSNVQIMGVTINPAGVAVNIPANQLPQIAAVEKEFCGTIDGQVALTNINGGDVIRVKIRVDGGNGIMQTGMIDFTVPAEGVKTNGRIVGTIPAIVGNMLQPRTCTHATIGTAKLVDKEGNEITDENEEGTLVIETVNKDFRIIINEGDSQMINSADDSSEEISKGFSHSLGLNNLFIENNDGTAKVRVDIADNPNLLPTGTLTKSDDVKTTLKVGDASASLLVNFTGGVPNIGDTISITNNIGVNYERFTFGDNAGQVQIGADWRSTLNNLKARIDQSSICKNMVNVELNALGNTLTFTAKNSGTSGNNIQIATNFGGGALANGVANFADILAHGTDKDEEITTYKYTIGASSTEGLQEIGQLANTTVETDGGEMTVVAYASVTSATIGNQVDSANNNAAISISVLNTYNDKLQDAVGIDVYEEYTYLIQISQYTQANMVVINTIKGLWQFFISAY